MTQAPLERKEDQEPKYAVLKWKDWQAIREMCVRGMIVSTNEPAPFEEEVDGRVLVDAEVIRKQDYTAAPIFHLYANLIQTFIDMGHTIDPAIRDHFHEAAMDAEAWEHKKVPD